LVIYLIGLFVFQGGRGGVDFIDFDISLRGLLFVIHCGLGLTILQMAGVHSFDFIGLGYRVDWPISIVLTPKALRVYAEIFTFLIQVKLAVLSLADVWCSLKVYVCCG